MQLLTLAGSIFFIVYSVAAQSTENVGPCTKAIQNAGQPMPGSYLPQCTEYGYFKPTQCHGSTGQCWCVNPETGKAIDGSSTFRTGAPQCSMCHIKRADNLRPVALVGGYVPTCDEEGLFETTQIHGSTGYSWCVNPYTGEEIPNTRVGPGQHRTQSCNDAAHMVGLRMHSALVEQGPCYAQMLDARGRSSMPGFYTPACTKNGYYKTEQHHSSTGYSWCVNPATGMEIAGTRRGPTDQKVSCGACFLEIEDNLTRKPLMGGDLAQCNEDNGDYLPVQHREGYSWCANPKTGAVEGPKNAPADKTPLPCVNQ
jgi:hypothetical protein